MFTLEYTLADETVVTIRRPPTGATPDLMMAQVALKAMGDPASITPQQFQQSWDAAMRLIDACVVAPANFKAANTDMGDGINLLTEVVGLAELPKAKSNGYGLMEPAAISP